VKKIASIIFVSFLTIALFLPIQSGFEIVTIHENKLLRFIPSKSGLVVIGWRHSVELQPWMEFYQAEKNGNLRLVETRFKSYGAGVPDMDGYVERIEDGFLVVRGIERKIPAYSLFYSPNAFYYIKTDGITFPLNEFIPPDTGINIQYKTRTLLDIMKGWKV
jgi:hypothetical protein